jgi:hypothetical protein
VRSPHHIIVSTNPVWEARQAGASFEEWPAWLQQLQGQLTALARRVEPAAGKSDSASSSSNSSRVADAHFPATAVVGELEQVLATLSLTASMDAAAASGSQPPAGYCTRLLLDVGFSYGAILDLYCRLLQEAFDAARDDDDDVVQLDVTEDGGYQVTQSERVIVNDAYRMHLLESGLSTAVQWLQVSTKHSVVRSKDGASSNALAELIRYNAAMASGSNLIGRGGGDDESKDGTGTGKLGNIFSSFSQAIEVLAANSSSFATSGDSSDRKYSASRKNTLAKLAGEIQGAKLLQQRFIADM